MTKSVVITGASTGIGKACALWMDHLGWRVFAGVRQDADAETLRAEASTQLHPIFIDVTDKNSIQAAAQTIQTSVDGQGLHGLVNNAGIAVGGLLEFMPLDHLRRQLEINVIGQLAMTQPMIPLLRQTQGRIVNMSSIAGRSASPVSGPYGASKHALEALSDSLRLELHPWNIHVALVEPGKIQTPIWQKSLNEAKRMMADYPPEAQELYGPLVEFGVRRVANTKGSPVQTVVRAVAHALTSEQPRIRYVIGRDARFRLFLEWLLPDRWRDRLFINRMPRYGR